MEDFFLQDRHIFVMYSKKCNKIVLLFCRPSICFCIHTPREAPWHCSQFLSGLKLKELFSSREGSAYSFCCSGISKYQSLYRGSTVAKGPAKFVRYTEVSLYRGSYSYILLLLR